MIQIPGDDAVDPRLAADPSQRRLAYARRLAGAGLARTDGSPGVEATLRRLTDLAARLLGARSAQVSIISDAQDVVAGTGAGAPLVGIRSDAGDSLCTVTVESAVATPVDDTLTDPRTRHLPPVALGGVRTYLGVPLRVGGGTDDPDEEPVVVGALCVYDDEPRSWTEAEVTLLNELSGPVIAELELAALRAEYDDDRVAWQLAVDAAGVGAWDWNLATGELRWDDRLLAIFGLTRDTFGGSIEAFNATVHPDDRARVSAALDHARDHCTLYEAEYRVVWPDSSVRWVAARGNGVAGPDGEAIRVVGAAYDTTAVRDQDARVARVLESMSAGFYQLDLDWRFRYVNAEAERLLGHPRAELLGGTVWDLFPATVGGPFEQHYRTAMETGRPVVFDAHYPAPIDGWFEVRAWPGPDGLAVYFLDISARRVAEEQLAHAARRNRLLSDVVAAMTDSLDPDESVRRLAPVLVPELGDWSVVSIVDEARTALVSWRSRVRDLGHWHRDASRRHLVQEYREHRVTALSDDSLVARALLGGEVVVVEGDAGEKVQAMMEPGPARDLVDELAPEHGVVVPLRARGTTVGLITLFRGADRPPFGADDLDVLEAVSSRAGLALDNARLFAQQRDLAEGLQRALLTPPRPIPGADVAVRYAPAADAAQVGGDWYDVFPQGDETLLVIGDVGGHDVVAAGAMGELRGVLRGVATATGGSTAEILGGVDRAMRNLDMDAIATAVVARLCPVEDGGTQVHWSNAGHPVPLVVHPDGRVLPLDDVRPDLLLGCETRVPRQEHTTVLRPGSVLLLYTDGLVERRGHTIDDGIARLQEVAGELAGRGADLDELCDELLGRMLPRRPEDDVAIVLLRLRS